MTKLNQVTNIALIFVLIGAVVCGEAYGLRVPIQEGTYKTIGAAQDKTEVLFFARDAYEKDLGLLEETYVLKVDEEFLSIAKEIVLLTRAMHRFVNSSPKQQALFIEALNDGRDNRVDYSYNLYNLYCSVKASNTNGRMSKSAQKTLFFLLALEFIRDNRELLPKQNREFKKLSEKDINLIVALSSVPSESVSALDYSKLDSVCTFMAKLFSVAGQNNSQVEEGKKLVTTIFGYILDLPARPNEFDIAGLKEKIFGKDIRQKIGEIIIYIRTYHSTLNTQGDEYKIAGCVEKIIIALFKGEGVDRNFTNLIIEAKNLGGRTISQEDGKVGRDGRSYRTQKEKKQSEDWKRQQKEYRSDEESRRQTAENISKIKEELLRQRVKEVEGEEGVYILFAEDKREMRVKFHPDNRYMEVYLYWFEPELELRGYIDGRTIELFGISEPDRKFAYNKEKGTITFSTIKSTIEMDIDMNVKVKSNIPGELIEKRIGYEGKQYPGIWLYSGQPNIDDHVISNELYAVLKDYVSFSDVTFYGNRMDPFRFALVFDRMRNRSLILNDKGVIIYSSLIHGDIEEESLTHGLIDSNEYIRVDSYWDAGREKSRLIGVRKDGAKFALNRYGLAEVGEAKSQGVMEDEWSPLHTQICIEAYPCSDDKEIMQLLQELREKYPNLQENELKKIILKAADLTKEIEEAKKLLLERAFVGGGRADKRTVTDSYSFYRGDFIIEKIRPIEYPEVYIEDVNVIDGLRIINAGSEQPDEFAEFIARFNFCLTNEGKLTLSCYRDLEVYRELRKKRAGINIEPIKELLDKYEEPSQGLKLLLDNLIGTQKYL